MHKQTCPICSSVSFVSTLRPGQEARDCFTCNPPPKAAKTAAQRQAEYRARKGKQVALILPDDVKAGLDAYLARQQMDGDAGMTMSDVVVKLLRQQLLRKR